MPRRMMCVTGVYVCVCPLPLEGVASSRGAARLETSHALTVTFHRGLFTVSFGFNLLLEKHSYSNVDCDEDFYGF